VGVKTCREIGESAGSAQLNFRDLFYMPQYPAGTFSSRCANALTGARSVVSTLSNWNLTDTLVARSAEIEAKLTAIFDPTSAPGQQALADWAALRLQLPDAMTLEEVLSYVWADNDVGQLQVLESVQTRLNLPITSPVSVQDRVRVLTMHGSKGLAGRVVFIPGAEQELSPGAGGVASPGALQERRRLLYVAITRARARYYLTRAQHRSGNQAFAMGMGSDYSPAPSQFITELKINTRARSTGLDANEVSAIIGDCANL
jgi:superfamily I DNA/RNA helicase